MHIEGIRVAGVACAVPKRVRATEEFTPVFGRDVVERFMEGIGVETTRVSPKGQTASDLCFEAARELVARLGVDLGTIGALVFITQTPDYRAPSTACVLASRLGLGESVLAFDVNLGCSGYVYGLNIVASLMKCNGIESALLLAGDTMTKVVGSEDRATCMLFGDAGSATLLMADEAAPTLTGEFRTDGEKFKAIVTPAGAYRNMGLDPVPSEWPIDGITRSDYDFFMDGTAVFFFTITEVPKQIKRYLRESDTSVDDFDVFAMHQANGYILTQIAKRAKIPVGNVPVSCDRYGNTSSASIPVTLCDAYGDEGREGSIRAMLCGFGVGLSWGLVDVELERSAILPIIETDNAFDGGAVSHE